MTKRKTIQGHKVFNYIKIYIPIYTKQKGKIHLRTYHLYGASKPASAPAHVHSTVTTRKLPNSDRN